MWFLDIILVGGWTNPLEKYARQNGFIFPNVRDENKRYLSCQHLRVVIGCFLVQQFFQKSAPATNPTSPNFPAFISARFQVFGDRLVCVDQLRLDRLDNVHKIKNDVRTEGWMNRQIAIIYIYMYVCTDIYIYII